MGSGKDSDFSDLNCSQKIAICIGIGVVLLLQLVKFAVGIAYWNDCPASPSIPRYISGSAGAETVVDAITGCISQFTHEPKGIFVAVAEHVIGIFIGSILVFMDYSYLAGGCDGAKECCDENFIKFALGVSIIEWLMLLLPIVIPLIGLCVIFLMTCRCKKLNVVEPKACSNA